MGFNPLIIGLLQLHTRGFILGWYGLWIDSSASKIASLKHHKVHALHSKVATMTFKARQTWKEIRRILETLQCWLLSYQRVRFSSDTWLVESHLQNKLESRWFSCTGPRLWNKLPSQLRATASISWNCKTFLFANIGSIYMNISARSAGSSGFIGVHYQVWNCYLLQLPHFTLFTMQIVQSTNFLLFNLINFYTAKYKVGRASTQSVNQHCTNTLKQWSILDGTKLTDHHHLQSRTLHGSIGHIS